MKGDVKGLRKKALSTSIKDGSASSISTSLSDSFVAPLAIEITPAKSSNIVVALLSSFSILFSQLAQIYGTKLLKKYDRKKIVLVGAFCQAAMWLTISLLAYLAWKNVLTGVLPYVLIVLYAIVAIIVGLYYPAWFSWMGDLVPAKQRGKYFSKRNLIIGIVGLTSAFIGGLIIEEFKKINLLLLGLSLVFILAFIFKMISFSFLKKQYHPEKNAFDEKSLGIREFRKKYKNFTKFSIYQMFFNFAIMVASPFFAVYMLRDLNLNYTMYTLISISSTGFYLLFLPLIGRFSDKYGNLKLFYISNFAFVVGPFLWAAIRNPILLIFLPQISTGLANASLTIAITNYTYSSVKHQHRAISVAYLSVLTGIGAFAGSLVGGVVLNYVPINFMNKFIFIFIVAGVLRLLVALVFLPGLKETQKTKSLDILHRVIPNTMKSAYDEIHSASDLGRSNYSQGLKVWKHS